MNCKCGGWQYCDVVNEKVVLKCIKCGDIQPISRDTPLRTESMGLPRVAMGRVW